MQENLGDSRAASVVAMSPVGKPKPAFTSQSLIELAEIVGAPQMKVTPPSPKPGLTSLWDNCPWISGAASGAWFLVHSTGQQEGHLS